MQYSHSGPHLTLLLILSCAKALPTQSAHWCSPDLLTSRPRIQESALRLALPAASNCIYDFTISTRFRFVLLAINPRIFFRLFTHVHTAWEIPDWQLFQRPVCNTNTTLGKKQTADIIKLVRQLMIIDVVNVKLGQFMSTQYLPWYPLASITAWQYLVMLSTSDWLRSCDNCCQLSFNMTNNSVCDLRF